MAAQHLRPPFRFARLIYRLYRAFVRIATIPLRPLPEGAAKARIRNLVLRFQNSLPTELVVNKGDTVVQVGTPHPRTMRRFRRAIGAHGRLVIVEAMPENQERLEQAMSTDGFTNIVIIKGAACNDNRMGTLAISPVQGDHRLRLEGIEMDNDRRPENARMESIPVKFLRLDEELPKHGVEQIDYLSVTVNGAEVEVLRGAEKLLRAGRRHARIYAKGHARDAHGKPIHIQSQTFMKDLGYETIITRGEPSGILDEDWLWRAGDLYAWKA